MNEDMRSHSVRLFQTLPHRCGYYADRSAQNMVVDPAAPELKQIYDFALRQGYRRAGGYVYYPRCENCSACIACRVPVARFVPDRSQRRCLRRNADLQVEVVEGGYSDERFALYERYLHNRHRGGGMDDATPEDFDRFLQTPWSPTQFIEIRKGRDLLGLAVTDFCAAGLSAVYTCFDPHSAERSLGTFAILNQIRIARERDIAHVYLGFWIQGHPKMHYKARFRPLEILRNGRWQELGQGAGDRSR